MSELDVKHFKLATGEEIISLVLGVEDRMLVLSTPLQLHIIKSGDTYGYTFSPFMPLSPDNTVFVLLNNVIAYTYVTDEVRTEYLNASYLYEDPDEEILIDELSINDMIYSSDKLH